MDRISSSTAGTVCTLTTPETSKAGSAPAAERAKDGGGPAIVEGGCFGDAPATAGSAEIPEPPAGPPDPDWEQRALDRNFAEQDKLEKQLNSLDPAAPDYQKQVMLISMKLQGIQQALSLITEMRKSRHDQIMQNIGTISQG